MFVRLRIDEEVAGNDGLYVGGRRDMESMKFPCAIFGGDRGTFKETMISYAC